MRDTVHWKKTIRNYIYKQDNIINDNTDMKSKLLLILC